MDSQRTVLTIEHNKFQEVAGAIRAQDEISHRVFAHLFHRESVCRSVLNVVWFDAMPQRRTMQLHG